MPPDARTPGSPDEWLRRARSNMLRAEQEREEGVYLEDLCFDAQQAVEKALKAVILLRGGSFRKVHDIGELLSALSAMGEHVPPEVRDAADLTEYAVEARYPGPLEPVTEAEYRSAIERARCVLEWAENVLQKGTR